MPDKIDKRTAAVLVPLGENIRRTRERLKIAQSKLAGDIGMEPTNLAKIERGEKNVTIDTLVRIADGLGVGLVVRLGRR